MDFRKITFEEFSEAVTNDHYYLTMEHAELVEIGEPSDDAEEELEHSYNIMMDCFLSFALGEEGTQSYLAAFSSKEEAIDFISEQSDSGIYGIEPESLFDFIDDVRRIAVLHAAT